MKSKILAYFDKKADIYIHKMQTEEEQGEQQRMDRKEIRLTALFFSIIIRPRDG